MARTTEAGEGPQEVSSRNIIESAATSRAACAGRYVAVASTASGIPAVPVLTVATRMHDRPLLLSSRTTPMVRVGMTNAPAGVVGTAPTGGAGRGAAVCAGVWGPAEGEVGMAAALLAMPSGRSGVPVLVLVPIRVPGAPAPPIQGGLVAPLGVGPTKTVGQAMSAEVRDRRCTVATLPSRPRFSPAMGTGGAKAPAAPYLCGPRLAGDCVRRARARAGAGTASLAPSAGGGADTLAPGGCA